MKTKRIISILVATAALASTGCQKLDSLFGKDVISFTSSTRGSLISRAAYGDFDESGQCYPVKWVDGDKVTIACANCSTSTVQTTVYDYDLAPFSTDPTTAKLVDNTSGKGLSWGDDGDYIFYAVSPNSKSLMTDGKVSFTFPETQIQGEGSGWSESGDIFKVVPNPGYMLMTSSSKVTKTDAEPAPNVSFNFSLVPTVFDLILSADSEMYIKTVTLSSTSSYLSGTVNLAIQESGSNPKGYLSNDKSMTVCMQPKDGDKPVKVSNVNKLELFLFVPAYPAASSPADANDLTNLSLSVEFSLDGGKTYKTLSAKLQDTDSKFLTFKPYLRHIITGIVVPTKWTIETVESNSFDDISQVDSGEWQSQ